MRGARPRCSRRRRHIVWVDEPYDRVLAVMPRMYDDLWTAAKGTYKSEPVVSDGGEVIIYAPHVKEVSHVHGRVIDEVGYHCRDYFLSQWDRFRGYPGGILAHSTHVKGLGTFDAASGVESPRIDGHPRHWNCRESDASTSISVIGIRHPWTRANGQTIRARWSCREPVSSCIGWESRRSEI